MSQAIRTTLAFILSLPLLAACIFYDLVKLPVLLFFVFPLWGLLDLICVLRGRKALLPTTAIPIMLMGVTFWLDILDLPAPRWLDPF